MAGMNAGINEAQRFELSMEGPESANESEGAVRWTPARSCL